ncbi:hypothetical protein LPJ71_006898, partial [Coemansia sp. S17]
SSARNSDLFATSSIGDFGSCQNLGVRIIERGQSQEADNGLQRLAEMYGQTSSSPPSSPDVKDE